MKGEKLRQVLEDLGFHVLNDRIGRGRYVRSETGEPIGFYDLHEDGAFRFGWTETRNGRTDHLDWPAFYSAVTRWPHTVGGRR